MRIGLILSLTAAWTLSGYAQEAPAGGQDIVKLKNGKYVSGTVTLDESDKDGFKVKRWDTGGTVYIKWSQVAEVERRRLLNKPVESGPAGEMLDGVRIVTSSGRDLLGVVDKEDENQVLLKTKDSASPVPVLKRVIISRMGIKIREADAYSPEEMIARRLQKADEKDAPRLIEIALFAKSLKLYEKAKDILAQALAADAGRKDEIDGYVAQIDGLLKEAAAAKKLADIKKLAEDGKFDEAVADAEKFVTDYAETAVGKEYKDLVAQLKKEKDEWEKNRTEFLAKKAPESWRSMRSSLLSEYAKSKYKIAQARSLTAKLDEELLDKLSKKFKCSPDDIGKAWERREQKKRTVEMGAGSWICKGGQDGGSDYSGQGQGTNQDQNALTDFQRRFGGNNKGGGQKPEDQNKQLQKSEEWWSSASETQRRDWLETEYAMNSMYVKKDAPVEKKCSYCQGNGTLKAVRNNQSVDVICPRCHNAKVDVSIAYW